MKFGGTFGLLTKVRGWDRGEEEVGVKEVG